VLAFFVIKFKLEYPLVLHQNLANKPCQRLIPTLLAVNTFACLQARNPVPVTMQRVGAVFNSSTIYGLATAPLRRGAACRRSAVVDCARCSAADSTALERPTRERPPASTFCAVSAPAVFMTGSQFSPNCDKLSRQTREFRNAVTYTKQTTAASSNRQNFQFCPRAFLASFQSDAGSIVTPGISRA
jgi:hypothetical protein